MTPLEIMAKARWDSRAEGNFPHAWEDFSDAGRQCHIADMRAALLALAEADLNPGPVIAAGERQIYGVQVIKPSNIFRAMLRAMGDDNDAG